MLTWHMGLTLNEGAALPIFLQIAQGIERAIQEGRLKSGDPLPGTRALGEQLGVNRNTVVAAYQELVAEGWLQTLGGGGTFVAETLPRSLSETETPSLTSSARPFRINPAPGDQARQPFPASVLSCLTGEVDPRMLPMEALTRAYQRAARTHDAKQFTHENPQGSERFRKALAGMLAQVKGINATPESLLILPGLREGLTLACRALLRPGDGVVVEALGSRVHWEVLRCAGATLHPVGVDAEGLCVHDLPSLLEANPIRLIVVTALRQYPTTVSLSPNRRKALLTLAEAREIPVLELDLDPGFHYEGSPTLPLAAEDRQGTVLYLGAFSKLLFPNLPVAFLHASPDLVRELVGWRQALAQGGDPFLERALAELLEDGEIQRHLNRLRRSSRERRDALAQALQSNLNDVLNIELPDGGLAFWLGVKDPQLDVKAWAERAMQSGLAFRPGCDYTFSGEAIPWLRMGFGSLSLEELSEAVMRLAKTKA